MDGRLDVVLLLVRLTIVILEKGYVCGILVFIGRRLFFVKASPRDKNGKEIVSASISAMFDQIDAILCGFAYKL